MINPVQLRTLSTVVHAGSFAAAAQRLGYTPSAVSQQISALEHTLRITLFERGARSSRPTLAARLIVERSESALATLDSLDDFVAGLAGGHQGRLRIGSFPTASEHLLPGALADFAATHPAVDIALEEAEPGAALPLVQDRLVDVAVVYRYDLVPLTLPRNVRAVPLISEHLLLLVPPRHRLVGTRPTLADLVDEKWISTGEGTSGNTAVSRACAAAGFVPSIDYRTNDYDVVRRFVESGLGVALVPALSHEPRPTITAVEVADLDVRRHVFAVHRRSSTPPALDGFITSLRRAAQLVARRDFLAFSDA